MQADDIAGVGAGALFCFSGVGTLLFQRRQIFAVDICGNIFAGKAGRFKPLQMRVTASDSFFQIAQILINQAVDFNQPGDFLHTASVCNQFLGGRR